MLVRRHPQQIDIPGTHAASGTPHVGRGYKTPETNRQNDHLIRQIGANGLNRSSDRTVAAFTMRIPYGQGGA